MAAGNKFHHGWIGVDFDGTLAQYKGWEGPMHVGAPVPAMLARVKAWLAEGREVRIFTARVYPITTHITPDSAVHLQAVASVRQHEAAQAVEAIRNWCREHLGQVLTVTCVKDFGMVALYDDRCVQVEANTGQLFGPAGALETTTP